MGDVGCCPFGIRGALGLVEADQGGPIAVDDDVIGVEVAVHHGDRVQAGERRPHLVEELVVEVAGFQLTEAAAFDRSGDDDGGPGAAAARRHDRRHRHPGARGGEQEIRLVLHLLEPRRREPLSEPAVEQRVAEPLEPSASRVVTPDDLHPDGAADVVGQHEGRRVGLTVSEPRVGGVDPEPIERVDDLAECRAIARRAEHEVHQRSDAPSEHETGEHVDRVARAEVHRPDRHSGDEKPAQDPHRTGHVRCRGSDDGDGDRQADGGERR